MAGNSDISRMTAAEKLAEALRRSLPFVPAAARGVVESLLRPETVGIVVGTLILWAGSHAFGIGEVVDLILLSVGAATVGFAVFEGGGELLDFARGAVNATTESQLDDAGRHFARAVTLLGVAALQAVLLRGQGRALVERGRPRIYPRLQMGEPPAAGNRLRVSRPAQLAQNTAGVTDEYGTIAVARDQSLTEQRLTLLHELVHRYFSPRTGPLRKLRAEVRMSMYSRSALLRYLEEALAEGYAQLRIHGLQKALGAYRFPLDFGYVTVAQMQAEGAAIGTITLGGILYYVSISEGPIAAGP